MIGVAMCWGKGKCFLIPTHHSQALVSIGTSESIQRIQTVFRNLTLICLAIFLSGNILKPNEKFTVALISIDGVNIKEMRQIAKNIRSYYHCDVYQLPPMKTPNKLMKNGKDTVLSSSLLQHIRKIFKEAEFDKIVAITEKPLYLSEQHPSIRGLGTKGGKTAVISTFKIKHESIESKKFYKSLLVKVSRHEIGHTLGLAHCSAKSKCVMTSGVNPKEFYSLKPVLCDSCFNLVQGYIKEDKDRH